ncbi:MAG: cbb3-type cytochrome oxidase maturation protein [Cellvibrionaceae bacterium]|jgi:cbb3-type cytochrome oxidase maturation protein
MSVLYLLIPIGLVILVLSVKLLFWAINNGQYDNLDMEGHRILFDDDTAPESVKSVATDAVSKAKEPSGQPSAQARAKSSTELTPVSDKPELTDENKSATSYK